jgi:hypothetical protein
MHTAPRIELDQSLKLMGVSGAVACGREVDAGNRA